MLLREGMKVRIVLLFQSKWSFKGRDEGQNISFISE